MLPEEIRGWFAGRMPDGWFEGPPEVTLDRDEILVMGRLSDVAVAEGAGPAEVAAARAARATGFREETRERRMHIAQEAEHRFERRVSWGVRIGDEARAFTTVSAPVMTRLRMRERGILDTLVDAGVARSRSDALAWCVRLVGDNEEAWIGRLREAVATVHAVRGEGPEPS